LRQRLQYLESVTGQDTSSLAQDPIISAESSKVDWAKVLLDDGTDDMIISVSRQKIASELIALRAQVKQLKHSGSQMSQSTVRLGSSGS
jgi:hypothetical protein